MIERHVGTRSQTTSLLKLVLVAAVGLASVPASAQIPSWRRFAPDDIAARMDAVAADLEEAILDFRDAQDTAFRELYEMPVATTETLLADLQPPTDDEDETETPGDPQRSDVASDGGAQFAERENGASENGAAEDAGSPASRRRAVEERWQRIREQYTELGNLVLAYPPGGGTVAFSAVERYLLEVHNRLGSSIDELHGVRDNVSVYLTSLRDRATIESYLTELSDQDAEGATQTHLRFLLQEAMAEWWLEILFGLKPEDWLPALRRQLVALGNGNPELRDEIARVIRLLELRGELYAEIAATPDDLASHVTIETLLSEGAYADTSAAGALSGIVRALGSLGLTGSVTPFARDPVFRATVARFSTVVSMLSTGQRMALAERLALPSLLPGRAVASGLTERRIDAADFARAQEVVDLADEAFAESELAERADDVHASYVADGEAAVERLASYLSEEDGRTDEQLQWSTLAVLENRYAQRLVSRDANPRVRDYLDSFVRRVNEGVDEGLAESLHADLVSAVSSAGLEPNAPIDGGRLAEILPASARRGRISVEVRPVSAKASKLRYDRSVAVRVRSETDTGAIEKWVSGEVARRYYAASFHAQTRSRRDVDPVVAARWMHTHGHSILPTTTAGGRPFTEEWIAAVEELLLGAALPWLDAAEQAVDFVQASDFRARGYARIHTLYNAIIVPALQATRPAIELDPTVRTVISIIGTIAEADVSTQKGEARLAGLLRVAPPNRAGFGPRTLVGAIVGLIGDDLRTSAQRESSIFHYARVAELARIIDDAEARERGVLLLRRLETYADRGWIDPDDAAALRRRVVARITDGEAPWIEEQ